MENLRTVDLKSFECGGKQYAISEQLSFARWTKLQELNIEFQLSLSMNDILAKVQAAKNAMNKTNWVGTANILYEIEKGAYDIKSKRDPSLRMCALYVNTPGEDLSDASEELINEKLDIWGKELDFLPFFRMAVSTSPRWIAGYNVYSQSTSSPESPTNDKET